MKEGEAGGTERGITRRDGSNDWSQNMFLWKIMDNYAKVIPITHSYMEHCNWFCKN